MGLFKKEVQPHLWLSQCETDDQPCVEVSVHGMLKKCLPHIL